MIIKLNIFDLSIDSVQKLNFKNSIGFQIIHK